MGRRTGHLEATRELSSEVQGLLRGLALPPPGASLKGEIKGQCHGAPQNDDNPEGGLQAVCPRGSLGWNDPAPTWCSLHGRVLRRGRWPQEWQVSPGPGSVPV